jgi:hypothetical protein
MNGTNHLVSRSYRQFRTSRLTNVLRYAALGSAAFCIGASQWMSQAAAQDAAPPPPAAPPIAPPPEDPPPAAAAAPPPAYVEPPSAIPGAPTESETTPPPEPPPAETKAPAMHVAAWARIGARFQGQNPKKLNDQQLDTVYGELHADGTLFNHVSLTLNLNANGLDGTAGIEDAIIGFDVSAPFHIWIGQMLVPADRANYGGPFFMIPWNYPGVMTVGGTTIAVVPHEGNYGRNAGMTVWGDLADAKFKYMLGAFDNGNVKDGVLFSGRLNLDLIGKEPGFFGNASYFGDQDVLALGVSGQYQRKGSVGAVPMVGMGAIAPPAPTDNYGEFSADVLAEFKTGGGGWFTFDSAYYHFVGDYQPVTDGFYALVAFASPKVGIGNIQPMFRFQYGKGHGNEIYGIDAFVTYLIKGPGLRITAGLAHTSLGKLLGQERIANAIQVGVQGIYF